MIPSYVVNMESLLVICNDTNLSISCSHTNIISHRVLGVWPNDNLSNQIHCC